MSADCKKLTNNELVKFIAQEQRNEHAWREFLSRFQQHICCTVHRECQWLGHNQGLAYLQDLVQEVYKKLLQNHCEALQQFKGRYENSILRFLEIIAIRIVQNDYRRDTARKRPPAGKMIPLNEPRWKIPDERAVEMSEIIPAKIQEVSQFELVEEIEHCLRKILRGNRHEQRDKLIFKYYLYRGINAEHIALLPDINLSGQRVFGIIREIKQKLRKCLGEKK